MKAYILQHEYELDGSDEVKLIGVYDSEAKAREARDRARARPGFADHPEGFTIDAYEIGQDHWTAGFASIPRKVPGATNRAA